MLVTAEALVHGQRAFLAEPAGDLGIKDEFKQRVQDLVQPGTSAILVIVRKVTPDKFLDALRPYGGTVLQTSLTSDAEQGLMKACTATTRPRRPGLSARIRPKR